MSAHTLGTRIPKAFISYSWDDDAHSLWVKDFAARLRGNGVDVTLDRWHLIPGDQVPPFMERAVRDNDFVLLVCTPGYKARSDDRTGGVGYEGDIMTAEVYFAQDHRKFIPLWRSGAWREAAPSWLLGKYRIDLRGEPYPEEGYGELLRTLHGKRQQIPPLGPRPDFEVENIQVLSTSASVTSLEERTMPTPAGRNFEDEIRAILRPLMGDRDKRQARLAQAFDSFPGLLDRINLDGETGVFLSLMLQTLRDYGDLEPGVPAIRALLEVVRGEVGAGDRKRIESIFRRLDDPSDRGNSQTHLSSPSRVQGQVVTMSQSRPTSLGPTIGIVTALDHEFVAMKAMLDSPRDYDVPGEGVRYVLGEVPGSNGRFHPVVLALGDMGESLAAIHTTQMHGHFPELETLLMVGIAGGVPNPQKLEDHVRLGDVVVSDRYGVVQFDFVKQTAEAVKFRPAPRPPSARLLQFARHLRTREMEGQHPWELHIRRGLQALEWSRPPASKDFLGEVADPKKRIRHRRDPARRKGQPRVFLGLIASSNTLLKDPTRRDELGAKFGAKAIEMETAGLADAAWVKEIGYLGVRGICDYCDGNKNDVWQEYAAMAAAAYVRALLESMSGAVSAHPQ